MRTYLEGTWPGNSYGESVYALNAAERQLLLDHIQQAHQASVLLGVINGGGPRFAAPLHFLAWPGVRVSVIETTPGLLNNGGKTVFAAKYEASLKQGHFLYPWLSTIKAPYRHGYGRLLPVPSTPVYVEASSRREDEDPGPHGIHIVRFNVPAAKPLYHVVLGPGADGYLVP